jgi:acetylglutamate kinase
MPPVPITPPQKARILAEALPFIRAFHASTLIIRFGGGAMADPVLKEGFARDVALLRLVGMNPIIVHGGGWRIDELLQTMGIPSRRQAGMRTIFGDDLPRDPRFAVSVRGWLEALFRDGAARTVAACNQRN